MKKIIMFNMISVDGFFASTDGSIDWHVVDDEFNKQAIEFLKSVDTILFGRVTYQLFESYWPEAVKDPATDADDKIIGGIINSIKKVVFSHSLKEVTWQNSLLLNGDLAEEVGKLKDGDGKDIVIYGSGTITQQLTDLGLIDEYRLMVAPVILGQGKPLFDKVQKLKLELIGSKQFSSGNMLLAYKPKK